MAATDMASLDWFKQKLEEGITSEFLGELRAKGDQAVETLLYIARKEPAIRLRQAAVTALGQLGQFKALLSLDDTLSAKAAFDALQQKGVRAIPVLEEAFNNPVTRKLAAILLLPLQRDKYRAAVLKYLEENLSTIHANIVRLQAIANHTNYTAVSLLQSVLREQSKTLTEEALLMVSALEGSDELRDALLAGDASARNTAFEKIKQVATSPIASLLTPLFSREMKSEERLQNSQSLAKLSPDAATVLRQLASPPTEAWVRSLAIFALGEIGTAYLPEGEKRSIYEIRWSKIREMKKDGFEMESGGSTIDFANATKPAESPAKPRRGLNFLDKLSDPPVSAPADPAPAQPASAASKPALFTKEEIIGILNLSTNDPAEEVRIAVRTAGQMVGFDAQVQGGLMLSTVEKIVFLKEVDFLQGLTADQLKTVAETCQEVQFAQDAAIYNQGDPGGVLFVILKGKVGIEREGKRRGSTTRIATLEAKSYFGEMALFDTNTRTDKAIALEETMILRVERDILSALVYQQPELAFKLYNALASRLREAHDRIVELSPSKPRELHKLYDKLD